MNKEPIHGPFIVGFNGPPRAGKDTAATLFAETIDKSIWVNTPLIQKPMAMPMRKAAMAVCGLDYSFEAYDAYKDTPIDMFGGTTLRQFMISLSEDFMKPKFGKDIWMQIWRRSIPAGFSGIVLVPDVGFQTEVENMISTFGPERVVMVQVSREGTSYVGDSRQPVLAERNFILENAGTLDDMATEISRLIGRLTNQYNWQL